MRYLLFFTSLVFCLISISIVTAAQVMEGMVMDNESKSAIQGVTVINKHRNTISLSDSEGYYTIAASPGDTILFTHTSYIPKREVMGFSLGDKYKAIMMQPSTYNLDAATITGQTQYQKDSSANRDMFTHAMNQHILKISPVMSPFSYIADKILGISKKAKRFRKDFNTNEQNAFIDTRYTTKLTSSQTGLTKDSLAYFMNSYPMEYQFARQASDLEIKMWIRYNYKQYRNKVNDSSLTPTPH